MTCGTILNSPGRLNDANSSKHNLIVILCATPVRCIGETTCSGKRCWPLRWMAGWMDGCRSQVPLSLSRLERERRWLGELAAWLGQQRRTGQVYYCGMYLRLFEPATRLDKPKARTKQPLQPRPCLTACLVAPAEKLRVIAAVRTAPSALLPLYSRPPSAVSRFSTQFLAARSHNVIIHNREGGSCLIIRAPPSVRAAYDLALLSLSVSLSACHFLSLLSLLSALCPSTSHLATSNQTPLLPNACPKPTVYGRQSLALPPTALATPSPYNAAPLPPTHHTLKHSPSPATQRCSPGHICHTTAHAPSQRLDQCRSHVTARERPE
jgi:hypothetical protein